ncbi:MAG: hypothetical protein K8U57_31735 [Planctomycetes bacterium]|nr:hypothetical protein [Planctomycetota bacterium]
MSSNSPPPEEPKTLLDKIGPALAVGLTALSAVFGSMSAAQLQQAMYWKSQAGQDQSKSANQWSLFGFKRSRALEMEAAAQASRSASGYLWTQFLAGESEPELNKEAAKWLNGYGPPRVELPASNNEQLAQLIQAIKDRKPEAELLALAGKIPLAELSKAIDDGEKFVHQTADEDWDKVVKTAKAMAKKVIEEAERKRPDQKVDQTKKDTADATQSLVFAMEDRRYRGEGAMNNAVGYLYEARVYWSSAESNRHRKKSETLGYAMLVAQIGAVAASLALARKKSGSLWFVATTIGLVSLAFGGYALIPATLLSF